MESKQVQYLKWGSWWILQRSEENYYQVVSNTTSDWVTLAQRITGRRVIASAKVSKITHKIQHVAGVEFNVAFSLSRNSEWKSGTQKDHNHLLRCSVASYTEWWITVIFNQLYVTEWLQSRSSIWHLHRLRPWHESQMRSSRLGDTQQGGCSTDWPRKLLVNIQAKKHDTRW